LYEAVFLNFFRELFIEPFKPITGGVARKINFPGLFNGKRKYPGAIAYTGR
jgi:hypothetical protein